jgi:serine/threonine protein kinase
MPPLATEEGTLLQDRLGKVMTLDTATTELAAMLPFMALDSQGEYGVYASASKPLRVDLSSVAKSAGGVSELNKCSLMDNELKQAHLLAVAASSASSPEEARSIIQRARNDMQVAFVKLAELKAAYNKEPSAERRQAIRQFFALNEALFEHQDMFQIDFGFASSGDMHTVIRALEGAKRERSAFDQSFIRAHLRAFANLARGLAVYHAGALVHRDIKPPNIVLANGTVMAPQAYKFIDFGESMPLSQARENSWQKAKYPFWPVFTRVIFSKVAQRQSLTKESLASEESLSDISYLIRDQATLKTVGEWWVPAEAVLKQLFVDVNNHMGTGARVVDKKLAEAATIHADLYGLFVPTLASLYYALTGVRVSIDPDKYVSTWTEDDKTLSSPFTSSDFGHRVHAAVAELAFNVSKGVLSTAAEAAAELQRIVSMF